MSKLQTSWRICLIVGLMLSFTIAAQPLGEMVSVEDGLAPENPENIQDDHIRLILLVPDYSKAAIIKKRIEDWLGPDMVIVQNDALLMVQAPRDPTERVMFIAVLLALEL
jgi:flagellar basal body P-ring protein FlgI